MAGDLHEKRALVTGSSSGIGASIARALASEGAHVIVHGRDRARADAVADSIRSAGGTAAVVVGDLASEVGAAAVAEGALAAFGGVDILVNNAGGAAEGQVKSWFAVPMEEWAVSYERNVMAAARLIRALAPGMKERGWGRIVQIATAAATIPTAAQPEYGTAKAAMLNMSLGVSKALAGSGVTVNAVSPGMIRTPGLEDFLRDFAHRRGWGDDIDQAAAYVLKGTGQTVHRIGTVEDVAYAVSFLVSPRADFLNGLNLHVDGGGTANIY